jgi:hypothetical protein
MKTATEKWQGAVNAEIKTGKPRDAAIAAVNKTHPGLGQMMLFEFQRENGNPRVAADWKRQAVEAGYTA